MTKKEDTQIKQRFTNEAFSMFSLQLYDAYVQEKIGLADFKEALLALQLLQDLERIIENEI